MPAQDESSKPEGGAPKELVFVYGTLRNGASNHWRMAGAEFVGPATVGGRLYRIDWYPGAILDERGPEVRGEVYRVSQQMLTALDEFEGAAGTTVDEFRRVTANAKLAGERHASEVWLWEYGRSTEGCEPVTGQDWVDYNLPRKPPLFLWVAWFPVLLVLGANAFKPDRGWDLPSGLASKVVAGMICGGPLVVTAAAWLALKRRERPKGLAVVAYMLGVAGICYVLLEFIEELLS